MNTVSHTPMICMPPDEYTKLLEENKSLKRHADRLNGIITQINTQNTDHLTTIEELRRENALLKDRIIRLEQECLQLKIEYKDLRADHAKFMAECAKMRANIIELKELVYKIEDRYKLNKFIDAIQDINRCDQLELNGFSCLRRLRRVRNSDSHYIMDDEDESIIEYKRRLLCLQLQTLEQGRISIALSKHTRDDNIVLNLIAHLLMTRNKAVEPSAEDKQDAEEWWEY